MRSRILSLSFLALLVLVGFETYGKGVKTASELPQFVLFTFDSGLELDFWKDSLEFAKENKLQFTYFLSGAYFVPRGSYGVTQSNIGFGDKSNIPQRLAFVNKAKADGHELASHGMTHFNGQLYTAGDWEKEFGYMTQVTKDVIFPKAISPVYAGYRSPYLSWNQELFKREAKAGMVYDASQTWKRACADFWPGEAGPGITEFPIRVWTDKNGRARSTMDAASHTIDGNHPEKRDDIRALTYGMYLNLFEKLYGSTRAPLVILTHFGSARMNESAYYFAMKDLAKEVCSKKDVRCVSIKSAFEWMQANSDLLKSVKRGSTKECAI